MGRLLVTLTLLTLPLGGCSLLYDPDRLAPAAEPVVPVVCESLQLERVYPTELLEGQGEASGRPALLVVHGKNIVAGATIAITAHDPADNPPAGQPARLEVDNTRIAVDRSGLQAAVPVTVHVDPGLAAARSIRLDVTVTQPCASTGAPAEASLTELAGGAPALALRGLDELTGTAMVSTAMPNLYSRVDVTKLEAADKLGPLIIRSTSAIVIGGAQPVSVSASGQQPGPGGFAGGGGGQAGVVGGAGNGSPGGGPGGGLPNGGGGGFAASGGMGSAGGPGGSPAGDPALTTLESPNRGSGGAGGRGATLLGSATGGAGGGGGGSIELTARGDMKITVPIAANGGAGGAKASDATSGGGGAGGAVLLRAGGALMIGSVTATGGPAGGADAGRGADGRIRFDAPARGDTIAATPAAAYRGPMFAAMTPLIVSEPRPALVVLGQASSLIRYVVESEDGKSTGQIEVAISGSGEATLPLAADLSAGANRICLLVTGVQNRRDEAENCISIALVRPE